MAEYIEREALLDDIDAAMQNAGMGVIVGQTLKRYVKRQPAADVVEVRHGAWIPYEGDSWKCSICGEENCYAVTLIANRKFTEKYCFNCGAKMDVGAD